jgi:hypothetical protein
MPADTLGALVWGGLVLCYAWSVWNLARQSRHRPDAGASSDETRIAGGTGERFRHSPATGVSGRKLKFFPPRAARH